MTDFSAFYVKTVRNGEADFTDHDAHSMVHHDSKTVFYDLSGLGVTLGEWTTFVVSAWDVEDSEDIEAGVFDADLGTFVAWVN